MTDFALLISSGAPELTNIIGKFINILYGAIGNFGWTVVVFAVILKLLLTPLDIWQKLAQRKQSLSMSRIQPQLEKVQKQYAARPDILKQKQAELYKKEKMGPGSMLGSCLPMIVTLVMFMVVFSGFTAMVKYQNELMLYNIIEGCNGLISTAGNGINSFSDITPAMINSFYTPESWLWVGNVFMPDTGTNVIPSIDQFFGTGLGSIGAAAPEINFDGGGLPYIFESMASKFNKQSFWNISKWNGYFVLPLLSIALSVLSAKAMQATASKSNVGTLEQQKKNKSTQKVMLLVMPLITGVFSMFYSAAFCIYMVMNSLISTIFAVSFNLITKKIDKKREENDLRTNYI